VIASLYLTIATSTRHQICQAQDALEIVYLKIVVILFPRLFISSIRNKIYFLPLIIFPALFLWLLFFLPPFCPSFHLSSVCVHCIEQKIGANTLHKISHICPMDHKLIIYSPLPPQMIFSLWLYSPIQALATSVKLSVSLQLLDLGQSAGLLGRVISSSQGLYPYTNTGRRTHITNTNHACPECDSNPRFRHPRERRQFMPYTLDSLKRKLVFSVSTYRGEYGYFSEHGSCTASFGEMAYINYWKLIKVVTGVLEKEEVYVLGARVKDPSFWSWNLHTH
jgi:hypothetical protein